MNHLAAARKDQQKRVNSRSMMFTQYDKIDLAAQQLWSKFITNKYADSKELNHDQFDILLNEWKVEVDPNVSAEIYFELLESSEEYDKEEVNTKQNEAGTANDSNKPNVDPLSGASNLDDSLKAKQKSKIEQNAMHVSKTGNRFHSDLLSIRQQYDSQQSQLSTMPTLNENDDTISETKETDEKNSNNTSNKNGDNEKKKKSLLMKLHLSS